MVSSNVAYPHTIKLAALVLALVALVLIAAACAPAPTPVPNSGWEEITIEQAAARRDAGAFMLDVRTDEEWAELHIPGATHIPLDELENRLSEVPTGQQIVVYCRSGNRSQPAAETLVKAGYTDVSSVDGGINDWKAAGFPTQTGP